jgi:hypothetical protein
LARGEFDGGLDHDVTQQIPGSVATYTFNSFATQPEGFSALSFSGNSDLGMTVKRRYLNFPTQSRRGKTDWHFAVQVVMVTLKDRVGGQLDHHIKISWRTTVYASFPFPG